MHPIRRVNIKKALTSQRAILKKQLLNAIEFQARAVECCPLFDATSEDVTLYDAYNPAPLRAISKHEASIPISREDDHRYGVYLETVVKAVYPSVEFHLQEDTDTNQTKATVSWTGSLAISKEVWHEPY